MDRGKDMHSRAEEMAVYSNKSVKHVVQMRDAL